MFTQPCFIRKNNEALRKKLRKLGYTPFFSTDEEDDNNSKGLGVNHKPWGEPSFFHITDCNYFIKSGFIDCGYNEELFFALAALDDRNDYMQWFTDGKDWVLCDRDDFKEYFFYLYNRGEYKIFDLGKFKKATANELIKHFGRTHWIIYVVNSFFLVLGLLELAVFCWGFYLLLLEDELRIPELAFLGTFIIILLFGFYLIIREYGKSRGYFRKSRKIKGYIKKRRMD